MASPDAVVLGGGPAGLAAALALARAGARPLLVEGGERVGGLCVTRSRDGYRYDLGGHIPFVRDGARLRWLRDLLGEDLRWVDRPVSCVREGRIVRGRYLDQEPARPAPLEPADGTAITYLRERFSPATVEGQIRPYLEKVDALPLERMPAMRVRRLHAAQAAPDGFWFPRGGIGQLMDAMAAATLAAGGRIELGARVRAVHLAAGRVRAVEIGAASGDLLVPTGALVVAVPVGPAARLMRPPPPPAAAGGDLTMRAVCLVQLALPRPSLTPEPWIQVADPRVPFARMAEPRNWSPALAPEGRTALGLECYCQAEPGDPVWGLDDAGLARRCAEALRDPLGLLEDPSEARLLDVVRLPRAYPVVAVDELPAATAPARWLAGVGGLAVAQGGAVVEAIEAGEAAAAALGADLVPRVGAGAG
jgi:phytoene dehydrogenase-like protein